MYAIYNAKSETDGEWTVGLFIGPNESRLSFVATRSALFAACVAADKMYRETLTQGPTEAHPGGAS